MSDNDSSDHAILVLMRGLPGSGKSYIANSLPEIIGEEKVVMLDPDATNYESKEYKDHTKQLTEEGVDPNLHAYRFLRAKAYKGIRDHKIIIWNQPFTNLEIFKQMIGRMQDHASENDVKLVILIVEVETDPKIAKERVIKRKALGGHGPSDTTFSRFVNDYVSFAHLGFSTVSVKGGADVNVSASIIVEALNKLDIL